MKRNKAIPIKEWQADIRERKRKVWADLLNSEPSGRPPGRRPRDPEQEALLAEADKRRFAAFAQRYKLRRVPVTK